MTDAPQADAAPTTSGTSQANRPNNETNNSTGEQRTTHMHTHITMQRQNTYVVAATAERHSATRKYFLKFMGEQIEQADGITSISNMVQLCSKRMSFDMDEDCRQQAPQGYDLLRQPLILPRSLAFDKKQVVNPAAGEIEHSIFGMYLEFFMRSCSDTHFLLAATLPLDHSSRSVTADSLAQCCKLTSIEPSCTACNCSIVSSKALSMIVFLTVLPQDPEKKFHITDRSFHLL